MRYQHLGGQTTVRFVNSSFMKYVFFLAIASSIVRYRAIHYAFTLGCNKAVRERTAISLWTYSGFVGITGETAYRFVKYDRRTDYGL